MSQLVVPIFSAVAIPLAASVLVPVVVVPASVMVSVVIGIVQLVVALTNVRTVPIGKATDPLAGIV
jgi:hypothetical protein